MPDPRTVYPYLERNHEVRVDADGDVVVRCPFVDVETVWSADAEPEEVSCELCQGLRKLDDPEVAAWLEHDCEDPDDDEPEDPPPIAGGAHGGEHSWSEYASCKVPLRRLGYFDVLMSVHAGRAPDVPLLDARWRDLGGRDFYPIRQADSGSYACRNSKGHSRAVSDDLNWSTNGYYRPRPANPRFDPQMKVMHERVYRPLGYGWGGNWNSAFDGMHHSKVPSEGGDGRLYVARAGVPGPTPPGPTEPRKYVVRRGETLSGIASRHGTTWQALARLNSLRDPDRLDVGQVLRLAPGASEHSHSTPTVRRGSKGDAVRDVQRHLRVDVDGDFGPITDRAVRAFQSSSGLVADGIVGARTWARLHA